MLRSTQLDAGAVYCWITADDQAITLTPLRNGGTKGSKKGFQPFGAALVTVAAAAPDAELGTAVLQALNRCE